MQQQKYLTFEEADKQKAKEAWNRKGVFGKAVNYASRGGYAISGAVQGALNGDGALSGAWEGLKGKESSFRDILEDQDILSGDSWGESVGRFVLGTGLDIATDPLSYVTMGTARAGTKLGTMAAEAGVAGSRKLAGKFIKNGVSDTLNKAGTTAFNKQVSVLASKLAARESKKLGTTILSSSSEVMQEANRIVANRMASGILEKQAGKFTQRAMETQKKYVSEVRLRWFGNEIPGVTEMARWSAEKIGKTAAAGRQSNVLAPGYKIVDNVRKNIDVMFGTGTGTIGINKKLGYLAKDIKADHAAITSSKIAANSQLIENIYKNVTSEQSILIGKHIAEGTVDLLPASAKGLKIADGAVNLRKIAKEHIAMNANYAKIEKSLGLLDHTRNNYISQIYAKVDPTKQDLVNNITSQQIGSGVLKHNAKRSMESMAMARGAGLDIIEDSKTILMARSNAHILATTNKAMMEDLAKSLGTVIDPATVSRAVLRGITKQIATLTPARIAADPELAKGLQALQQITGRQGQNIDDVSVILKRLHQMPENQINKLINSSTDDVMVDLYKGQDLAAGKFTDDLLLKTKLLDGNTLDIKKLYADNITVMKTTAPKIGDKGQILYKGKGKNMRIAMDETSYLIPDSIKKNFIDSRKASYFSPEVNAVLRPFDALQNFWKGDMTVLFPSFHARNALSNVAQNFQDIGLRALSPAKNTFAKVTLGDIADPKKLAMMKKMTITTSQGVKYNAAEVQALAKQYSVLTDMAARLELTSTDEIAKFYSGGRKSLHAKAIEQAGKVGKAVENQGRMLNFVSNLEKYGDPARAAIQTKKFLFDYGNVTSFEKSVMKRLIPFYTWQSKNVKLMSDQLITNYGRYVQKAHAVSGVQDALAEMSGFDRKNIEEYLPEYMKDAASFVVGQNDKGDPILLNKLGFPEEAYLEYMGSLFSGDVQTWFRKVMGSATMPVKAAFEMGTGQSLFLGQPIEKQDKAYSVLKHLPGPIKDSIGFKKVKDKRGNERYIADPWKLWALQSSFFSRYYSTIGKLMDDDMDGKFVEKMLEFGSGLKFKPMNMEKQKDWMAYAKKRAEIEGKVKSNKYTVIEE